MHTQEHISEAIALAGGASVVARHFTLTPWAVSKWIAALPAIRVIGLSELTGWRKSPHQLCPDLYPHPFDGLPYSLRAEREVLGVHAEGGGASLMTLGREVIDKPSSKEGSGHERKQID